MPNIINKTQNITQEIIKSEFIRPSFISANDIVRWSKEIDKDSYLTIEMKSSSLIREVCLAGLFLVEELKKISCPSNMIARIQWTAGKMSFGRDIWKIHQEILESYKNNSLTFEEDMDEMKN